MTTNARLLQALSDAVAAAGVAPRSLVLPEERHIQLNGVELHYLDWGNVVLDAAPELNSAGLAALSRHRRVSETLHTFEAFEQDAQHPLLNRATVQALLEIALKLPQGCIFGVIGDSAPARARSFAA